MLPLKESDLRFAPVIIEVRQIQYTSFKNCLIKFFFFFSFFVAYIIGFKREICNRLVKTMSERKHYLTL